MSCLVKDLLGSESSPVVVTELQSVIGRVLEFWDLGEQANLIVKADYIADQPDNVIGCQIRFSNGDDPNLWSDWFYFENFGSLGFGNGSGTFSFEAAASIQIDGAEVYFSHARWFQVRAIPVQAAGSFIVSLWLSTIKSLKENET